MSHTTPADWSEPARPCFHCGTVCSFDDPIPQVQVGQSVCSYCMRAPGRPGSDLTTAPLDFDAPIPVGSAIEWSEPGASMYHVNTFFALDGDDVVLRAPWSSSGLSRPGDRIPRAWVLAVYRPTASTQPATSGVTP